MARDSCPVIEKKQRKGRCQVCRIRKENIQIVYKSGSKTMVHVPLVVFMDSLSGMLGNQFPIRIKWVT